MADLLAVTLGYVIGSVPFAFLLSRRRGIDLRRVGSGNVGASNVLRTSGLPAAITSLCLDAAKGSCAVAVAQWLAMTPATAVAAGLASILGHIYPVWLGFKGGKGVATSVGVFAVLAPAALATATGVFVLTVWTTRYISLGSVIGAVALAVVTAASDLPSYVVVGAATAALLIVYRHRGNLARLVAGTERRVGQGL
jgi:glycerol-3-phosphate acyltransferase PlsY